jgi:predicted ATP-dependent endonuclease of OLD family
VAHIVEFSVQGLAGRKDVYQQKLNRDVNVFFGLNGSGKTSLLKILTSAMEGNAAVLKTVPFSAAQVKIYSINFDQIYTYFIDKSPDKQNTQLDLIEGKEDSDASDLFDFPDDDALEWSIEPKIKTDKKRTRWSHRYLPTTRLYFARGAPAARNPQSRTVLSEEQLEGFFTQTLQHIWLSYASNVLVDVRRAQEVGLTSILRDVLSGASNRRKLSDTDPAAAYKRVTTFLARQAGAVHIPISEKDFVKRYKDDLQLRNVVEDIEEVEQQIERAVAPRDSLVRIVEEMLSGNKKVIFTDRSISVTTADGAEISIASLSSGEKHLLRILIESVDVGENALIIDEPELSMHVDWQRKLVGAMQQLNPRAQLILATHSPEIMAELSDDKIFRV